MGRKTDEAVAWLRHALAGGPCAQGEVLGDALAAHISRPTLRQAKIRLGVVSKHRGQQGSLHQSWWWEMPVPAEGEGEAR